MFQSFLYEEPSAITTTISVAAFAFVAFFGICEIIGKHLQFCKFCNVNTNCASHSNFLQLKLSSRIGMLILYTPSCLMGFASFLVFPHVGTRCMMLKSAVTIHFLKRVLEVLFVHKYSGAMVLVLGSVLIISSSYFMLVAFLIYIQHLIQGYREPQVDLKYVGLMIFFIGICGNFYHHYLLSKLRDKREQGYKIPQGGLFSMVICPHYLFEILDFLGISFISQISLSFSCVVGSTVYLMGRSYVTRKWYISKFKEFPNNVKALIPFVF
ncbi:uncharacterized protein LOC132620129 [Lycium barbarum]|uniref:uncharacterized protein LOC132620129 n=1 Tax=Lycium barbarum TaxID=112863 RepID=UPI00293F00E5|nr:uncharacterized protein LOC132620129 [Lycium barbarum]